VRIKHHEVRTEALEKYQKSMAESRRTQRIAEDSGSTSMRLDPEVIEKRQDEDEKSNQGFENVAGFLAEQNVRRIYDNVRAKSEVEKDIITKPKKKNE
jgi:hypothetical protein